MTFSEAARLMIGSSKDPVIQPLSVTKNGIYAVPEGVDGYSPVNVGVPDRYQEGYDKGKTDGEKEGYDNGYADGVKSVVIKPLTVTENKTYNASDYECSGFNPVNGNVPDKYQDGYDDGFEFAYGFYNKIIDPTNTYTMYLYTEAATPNYNWPDSLKWIMCQVRKISDNSLVCRFNFWPGGNGNYCHNAVFTKVWYQKDGASFSGWHVEIESTDAAGENKQRREAYLSYTDMIHTSYNVLPSNTNVVCDAPPTE